MNLKKDLLNLGIKSQASNPKDRLNIYIPIYAGGELIWDAQHRKHENQHIRLDKINVENKTVLDIGCNTGYISFRLANQAKHIIGIDKDPDILEVCNLIKEIDQVTNVDFIEIDKYKVFDSPVNILSQNPNYPFDVALNLSNFDIDITVRELKYWGNAAKVWYIEPTNHPDHFKDKDEFKKYGIEQFSQFGEVEFLTYTDYQHRGMFKLTMNEGH